jgi:hypothetical protein
MVTLIAFLSLLASSSVAHNGLLSQTLSKQDNNVGFYNPVRCQELLYLNNQIAIYYKNSIEAEALSAQAGYCLNVNNKAAKYLNGLNLPAFKKSSRADEMVFFYLLDDDINAAICFFRPIILNSE